MKTIQLRLAGDSGETVWIVAANVSHIFAGAAESGGSRVHMVGGEVLHVGEPPDMIGTMIGTY